MQDHPLTTVDKLYVGVQLIRPLLRNITTRVETDLAGTGISVGQRAILEVLLAKERATAPELTSLLQLKRQFVARELQELLKKGMVHATPNPRHKKSLIYTLSETSSAIIQHIRHREVEKFTEFSARFTPEEIDAYYRIQKALNEEMAQVPS